MAIVLAVTPAEQTPGTLLCSKQSTLRAYSDPVIFRDDRVLRTLLRKEAKYVPTSSNYFEAVQKEIDLAMRKEVSGWMLEICEDQQCLPEVFCLAMNYLDRFLSVCPIGRSQLQLLGAVCLLVAWKVREHDPLPAPRLVEYSDFNLTLSDIMEWEVLLLSKLDWDMSAVIASDFVEHIIQRVRRLHLDLNTEIVRQHSETLITMCSAHYDFSAMSSSLVAAACVLTTLRPILDNSQAEENKSSPSESSKSSSSKEADKSFKIDMDTVLEEVETVTLIEKKRVRNIMDRIEVLMRASLSSSPDTSLNNPNNNEDDEDQTKKPSDKTCSEYVAGNQALEQSTSNPGESSNNTPTKVLDVAETC